MYNNHFLTYLRQERTRLLPKVNQFLQFTNVKIEESIRRSSYTNSNSYGVRLLAEIIKSVDLEVVIPLYLDKKFDLTDLTFMIRELEQPIDSRVVKTRPSSNYFISSRVKCDEVIIPVRRKHPMIDIPHYVSYQDARWDNIRPFRMMDISDCDLVYTAHQAKLLYHGVGPKFVVYTLDTVSLVSKFLSYFESHSTDGNLELIIMNFLHEEIVIPTLVKDSVSLWIRNNFRKTLISGSPLRSFTMTLWDNINGDTLGTTFNAAQRDVEALRTDLIKGSISPLVALSSLKLSPDTTFTQYYLELGKNSIPGQYATLGYLYPPPLMVGDDPRHHISIQAP